MIEIIKKLEYAKDAVLSIIENANCSVDFKGLKYWASEVKRLREEVKSLL